MTSDQGLLIVLCGPSGVGKSTLSHILSREMNVEYVPAITTRERRLGDEKGKTYEYVSRDEFFRRLDADELLEYAQIYDDYYATPKHPALDHLAQGQDLLLEIDVQGALQVRHHYPKAALIFILPPDERTLERRLIDRGRDKPEDITKRFRAAKREVHMAKGSRAFDHMVVNDDLGRSSQELQVFLRHRRAALVEEKAFT